MANSVEQIVIMQEPKTQELEENFDFDQIGSVCRCCLSSSNSMLSIELMYDESNLRELFERYTCLKVRNLK